MSDEEALFRAGRFQARGRARTFDERLAVHPDVMIADLFGVVGLRVPDRLQDWGAQYWPGIPQYDG